MNRIKVFTIVVIFFSIIASPATAVDLPYEAVFFYGITIDDQLKANTLFRPQKSLSNEVDLKEKKTAVDLPYEAVFFYGVTIDDQLKANTLFRPQKSLSNEVDLKHNKSAVTQLSDILNPDIFFRYAYRNSK